MDSYGLVSEEKLWKTLWSDLSNKIDRELPGEPLWSQSVPIENGDTAEGLAIRRAPEGGSCYVLVYFRLVPVAIDQEAGEMIGGEDAGDWSVEVGYRGDFGTLEEAKAEANRILRELPTPPHMEAKGYDFFLNLLRP